MGHVMKDCPSRRAFIATEDGYVSASDVKDDLALAANVDADSTEGDQDKEPSSLTLWLLPRTTLAFLCSVC
jgi:hypothetical protein